MNNNIEKEIFDIYLYDILPNRFQPRLSFDEKALNELAESIRQHGIIQPLVVRRLGDKYEIIAGERRYKAAAIAGLKSVPAIVMDIDDNKSAEIAIVENIQRKEMTPLEEAKSYKKLLERGYLNQEQLGSRMGKSQSSIANKLRLLNLDEEVQEALLREQISERHARSLLTIKNPLEQKETLKEIINNKLTVKQTDDLIKQKFGVINIEEEPGISNKPTQFYSNPLPKIPNPYEKNEPNPQINIINELNRMATKEVNMEKFDEPVQIDISKLKETAEDIYKPTPITANLENLLEKNIQENTVTPVIETPKNRFLMELENSDNNIDLNFNDIEVLDLNMSGQKEKSTESVVLEKNTKNAIDLIKNNISTLESIGFKVSIEEFDFEKLYQITIKIEK